MAGRTVVQRVKDQRDVRLLEGWQEVRVWVPTDKDARDVRELAAERRAKAEALTGLSEEISSVTTQTEARIAQAIAEHGSAAYNTPSGAVLELMTDLANEDDLEGFSRAVVILARAKPSNAHFVIAKVPAKISNFLVRHRGIDASTLMRWTEQNSDWADTLKSSVRNPPKFAAAVERVAEEIKAFRRSN